MHSVNGCTDTVISEAVMLSVDEETKDLPLT